MERGQLTSKPSGIPWLGEVPDHWKVKRLKYLASTNDDALSETADPTQEIVYVEIGGVDAVKGIVAKEQLILEDAPSRARRVVKEGDTIISTVRTYLRAIAPIRDPEPNLIVSTGFAVIRPRGLDLDYLGYALRAPYFVETIVSRSNGVSYPGINASEIGNIEVAYPPLPEQRAIAAFLDERTARIDGLVARKRRLVHLLKEKRQALITRAVTRGLDASVKLKPSGVPWLGDVPEGWEVKRFKHVVSIFGRIGFRGYTTDDLVDEGQGALALGASHIKENGRVDVSDPVFLTWAKYYESPEIMIAKDDLIVVQRGSVGKVAHINVDLGYATINPSLVLLKNAKANPRFLLYVLLGGYIQSKITTLLNATAVPMLSQEQVGNFDLLLPSRQEQDLIVEYLEKQTMQLDILLTKVEEAIDLLKEYRTALISAAVTGKMRV
jgi:type I restriction enzyme S subunit